MNIIESNTNPPLRFVEIDAGELPSLGRDLVAEIYDCRLVGVIIRGAFSASTAARVVERLESGACIRHQQDGEFYQGSRYGRLLVSAGPDLRGYFDDAQAFRSDFAALFEGGPDFQTRIEELLVHAHAGRPASVPRGPGGETYEAASIRVVASGGKMDLHCEAETGGLPSMSHLASLVDVFAQLSFFVTLAPSESGGELHISALRVDDAPAKMLPRMDERADEETLRSLDPFGELVVRPAAGDLLLFNGGRFFHRVAPIVGSRPRWTVGGFVARSLDGKSLFYWS